MIDATPVPIRSVRTIGPDTIALDIETPDGFDPLPGQFVKLTAFVDDEHVTRFYTLSSPGATDTFEITVEIDPDGTLGPWLADGAGEEVQIEGPYGHAFYDGEAASIVMAGGPGIGAAVGIGEAAVADDNDVTIIYRGAALAHQDRLDALAEDGATVERADDLENALEALATGDEQLFAYGFQDFVTDAVNAVEAIGGESTDVKVENFG